MLGITSWGNINENASTCQIPGSTVNNNCLVTLLCLHTSWQCSQNTDSWQCIWDHTHGLCSYDHFTMPKISVSLTQVTIECQMEQLKKKHELFTPRTTIHNMSFVFVSEDRHVIIPTIHMWEKHMNFVIVLYTWTIIVEHLIQPFSLGQPINQVVPAFLLVLDSSFCLQC